MTFITSKFSSFEEYLSYDGETDNRYELVDGELIALPPEAEPNSAIAVFLLATLMKAGVPLRLIKPYTCEVQVPVLRSKDAQNRFPDLIVLREEHLELTQIRLTITLDMPPPLFIAEVVSPGKTNRDRDYIKKRDQYCQIGVQEYWIIDPKQETVLELVLENAQYTELGNFQANQSIVSWCFPTLQLTAAELFASAK
jgi:Uma2 family endonuclease